MSILSRSTDTFYAFRFLRLLTTNWEDMGAYKVGIIDKDGKKIKKPSTSAERSKYNIFHRLVFSLKRLLNKIPLGKSTIASYLAALYLIKENLDIDESALLDILNEVSESDFSLDDLLLSENDDCLLYGEFQLKRNILHPMTLEELALEGSNVSGTGKSCGTIFGHAVYEVYHHDTKSKIKITKEDIK